MIHQFSLLRKKRFLPLFLTQFLGAFNDNVYKNALVILITYQFAENLHLNAEILITIAAGIFILPYFLFSALAGQLADKWEKSHLVSYTKLIEVILMVIAALGFYFGNLYLLMSVLFLLGTQATFFGPLKYSILPDHLQSDELIAGNALIGAGTFLAILLGTILGGILVLFDKGALWVSITTLLLAFIGLFTSFSIPKAGPAEPQLSLEWNLLKETWRIIQQTAKNKTVFLPIIGISWFWLVGGTYLSQFPTYGKNVLNAESSVVTLFLTLFSIGIGVGALLCNTLLKGKVNATYVPWATLGMTFFGIDLVFASVGSTTSINLISLSDFLTLWNNWRILLDLLCISISGGIYIVPLYAIIQQKSPSTYRSRVIGCNNILNALFMVIAAIGTSIMLAQKFSVSEVFLVVASLNLVMFLLVFFLLKNT